MAMHLCNDCGLGYPTYPTSTKCGSCGGRIVGYVETLTEIGKLVGRHGEGGRCVAPEEIRDGILGWRMRAYRAEKALERLTGIEINAVVDRLSTENDPVLAPATINLALTEEDKDRMVPLAHAGGMTLSTWALHTLRRASRPKAPTTGDDDE